MRKTLLSLIAATIGMTLVAVGPSNAAEAPWCLRFATEGYSVDMCDYKTFEACNQQRISEGNKSSCFRNPASFFPDQNEKKPGNTKRSAQ